MTQILLINAGPYVGLDGINFPVVVTGTVSGCGEFCNVSSDELLKVGACRDAFDDFDEWPFRMGDECEVIG